MNMDSFFSFSVCWISYVICSDIYVVRILSVQRRKSDQKQKTYINTCLFLLATRIYITRCCWFNICWSHVTQKVMTVLWGTMMLLLLRHVSRCGFNAVCGRASQRESSGSELICRQAWWDNFHILLCRLWSPLSPHQHVASYHTAQSWPSQDKFLMFSHARCFQILLSAVKIAL